MLLTINNSVSLGMESIMNAFRPIANDLQKHFAGKTFGEDIKEFNAGFVAVAPEFRSFFKPRKNRYIKEPKTRSVDGIKFVLEKTFEMEIELPYDEFIVMTIEEAVFTMCKIFYNSIKSLTFPAGKVKGFDVESFSQEVRSFFLDKGIMVN